MRCFKAEFHQYLMKRNESTGEDKLDIEFNIKKRYDSEQSLQLSYCLGP